MALHAASIENPMKLTYTNNCAQETYGQSNNRPKRLPSFEKHKTHKTPNTRMKRLNDQPTGPKDCYDCRKEINGDHEDFMMMHAILARRKQTPSDTMDFQCMKGRTRKSAKDEATAKPCDCCWNQRLMP